MSDAIVGLDIETASVGEAFNRRNLSAYKFDCDLRAIQLSDGTSHLVVDLWHCDEGFIDDLRAWINEFDGTFVGANLGNFDIPILRRFGFHPKRIADLSQLSRLAHNNDAVEVPERKHSLANMLEREFGLEKYNVMGADTQKEDEEKDEYSVFGDPEPFSEEVYDYCLRDVEYLVQLYHIFACQIPKQTLELEIDVMNILADVTHRGMAVDVAGMEQYLESEKDSLEKMQEEVEEVLSIKNFNIGSPASKAEFFSKLSIPKPKKWDKKAQREKVSYDSTAISELYVDIEDEEKLSALRSFASITAAKKMSATRTYLTTADHGKDNQRVHPGFHGFGTRTGPWEAPRSPSPS